ncbi:hypothetical protein DAI22_04g145700 [Oryza sativa Japonica Group]|nr:hypothetical protein DAI22_04g145700 [Oryza sativa Japonica Group]
MAPPPLAASPSSLIISALLSSPPPLLSSPLLRFFVQVYRGAAHTSLSRSTHHPVHHTARRNAHLRRSRGFLLFLPFGSVRSTSANGSVCGTRVRLSPPSFVLFSVTPLLLVATPACAARATRLLVSSSRHARDRALYIARFPHSRIKVEEKREGGREKRYSSSSLSSSRNSFSFHIASVVCSSIRIDL